MTKIPATDPEMKLFIRQVLGCGCPEHIFLKMICQQESLNDASCTSINVGDRLLVFLAWQDNISSTKKTMDILFNAGKERRDRLGFNRFRLVLVMDQPEFLKEELTLYFDKLRAKDEKIHLHILSPTVVPAFLLR